jgi:septation ring formation regulator EzrA
MSRSPNYGGVKKLRELAARYRTLLDESYILSERIASDTHNLNKVNDEFIKTKQEIVTTLEEMDCATSGNGGWENRIAWMLAEFEKQVSTDNGR